MAIELKVPPMGESISEVEVGAWLKSEGDAVQKDENVVVIESEKASMELPAPQAGTLTKILKKKGEIVPIGTVIAQMEPGAVAASPAKAPAPKAEAPKAEARTTVETKVMPAARKALAERGLSAAEVAPTGPGGRLLKEDVLKHENKPAPSAPAAAPLPAPFSADGREVEVVPMSMLRRTIAKRLVEAQQTMAMLTTFNEVDMSAVMALRKEHQEAFVERHGTKLGFMSFFVKAVIDALKLYPQLNAEIRGNDIVYHNYYDIGVAIGAERGLVVPVIRNAERMSFAEIEKAIGDFGKRAKENKIKPEELQGGTFTISNGGVYGSLLSTPIINPPQTGILGMHSIQERPIAVEGQVVIRPMMYLALSYDHRIVDGREAVSFLKRIKEVIEKPARMLIEV
ncbi:MAG: 2-oxoglutarate dehydrogenase complex dihydrolipoyllysine-residue succinyltransferase [Verrucomicrobiota bacterium]